MSDLPDTSKTDGTWTAPRIRVAIFIDANGDFDGVAADEPIEFYVVQPSCERDRNYRYSTVDSSPGAVDRAFAGRPIGHADDDMWSTPGRPRPVLRLVPSPSKANPS